ncbi:MAG: BLUF domain-containing protein [Paracoccus sp. (in: a-proteobacteria)]|nr:BLUF domain-containing protein [Paracoccus sp. (in: a-proteobacteria)]
MLDLACFLYSSTGRIAEFDSDCEDILTVATQRNAELGLTGLLHCEEGMFFQWLEGPPDAVAMMRETICRDPRHTGVRVLAEGPIDERKFAAWSMRKSTRADGSVLDWLADREVSLRNLRDYAQELLVFMQTRILAI